MVDKETDMDGMATRVALLEEQVEALTTQVRRLEAPAIPPAWLGPAPEQVPLRPRPAPQPQPRASDPVDPPVARVPLADLLAGRLLAWAGGTAVLVGIVCFFALAVSRGWVGEGMRTLLGTAFCLALVAAGVWLREQRDQRHAALAAAGAGLAGLFVAVTIAAQQYELVAPVFAAVLSLGVGAGATVLAVRWRSTTVAALGIVGGLTAPVLAGAPVDGATLLVLTLPAGAAAAAVLVWQRWTWLMLGAWTIVTAQWCWWVADQAPPTGLLLSVVAAFGVLGVATATGYELRVRATGLRRASAVLLTCNAAVTAAVGAVAAGGAAAHWWLVALAVAHLAVGLAGRAPAGATHADDRISHELALLSLVLGVVLGDIALASVLDGLAVPLAYATTAAGLAGLHRLVARSDDTLVVELGLGGHVALALGHALVGEAPPAALSGSAYDAVTAAAALGAVAAACLAGGRVLAAGSPLRVALDVTGLASVAFLTALVTDDLGLVLAWAGEAVALATIGRVAGDAVARAGAYAFLAGAAATALATLVPPSALVDPLAAGDVLPAVAGLGGVLGAAGLLAHRERDAQLRALTTAATAVLALLLASVLVVATELGQEQLWVSALWSATGVAALLAGLVRDRAAVRLGALALLAAATAKVFLYDLSTLDSLYRVASATGLGLLLLAAAAAWQRLRD